MRDALIIAGIIAAGLAILAGTMNLPLWAFLVLVIFIILILGSGFYRRRNR